MSDRPGGPNPLAELANDAELRAIAAGASAQHALNVGNAAYLLHGMGIKPGPNPLDPFSASGEGEDDSDGC